MSHFSLSGWRALAGAVVSAVLVAAVGLVSSSAAEPGQGTAAPADAPSGIVRPWSQHVQAHLDRLAERLEIKASQQAAWQKFSAAFKETAANHVMLDHAPLAGNMGADADAATLARRRAERAEQHAQLLARLADATAALQASLSADQRLVFNEVARHYAAEHGMGPMAHWGHGYGMYEHHDGHCSGPGMGHGYDDDDGDAEGMHVPHGPGMMEPHGDDTAPHEMPR